MSDMIDRQAAIEMLRYRFRRTPTYAIMAMDVIKELPPAQPMTELEAYYKGKIDGIKECTERLKKLNISLRKGEADE